MKKNYCSKLVKSLAMMGVLLTKKLRCFKQKRYQQLELQNLMNWQMHQQLAMMVKDLQQPKKSWMNLEFTLQLVRYQQLNSKNLMSWQMIQQVKMVKSLEQSFQCFKMQDLYRLLAEQWVLAKDLEMGFLLMVKLQFADLVLAKLAKLLVHQLKRQKNQLLQIQNQQEWLKFQGQLRRLRSQLGLKHLSLKDQSQIKLVFDQKESRIIQLEQYYLEMRCHQLEQQLYQQGQEKNPMEGVPGVL